MDSFSNLSIGDVSGALNNSNSAPSSDPEKKLDFYPDLSYGGNNGGGSGGTTANNSLRRSSSMTSLTSVASSITYPSPVLTRQDSSAIEISSVHRDSTYNESINIPSNFPSESPRPLPQPAANHNVV